MAPMDSFPHCLTSAYVLTKHDRIFFIVLRDSTAVKRSDDTLKIPLVSRVARIVGELRELGYLTAYDRRTFAYWIFSFEPISELDLNLEVIASTAADCSKGAFKGSLPLADTFGSASSPHQLVDVVLQPLASSGPSGRQADGDTQESDLQSARCGTMSISVAVRTLLLASLHAKLTCELVRQFSFVPLACDKFMKMLPNLSHNSSPAPGLRSGGTLCLRIALDISSADELIARSNVTSKMYMLSHPQPRTKLSDCLTLVRVSPSGKIGRVVDIDRLDEQIAAIGLDPKFVVRSAVASPINQRWWRHLARQWIKSVGLGPAFADEDQWVGLLLPAPQSKAPSGRSPFIVAEWPSAFCLNMLDEADESISDSSRSTTLGPPDDLFEYALAAFKTQLEPHQDAQEDTQSEDLFNHFKYRFKPSPNPLPASGSIASLAGQYPTPPSLTQSQTIPIDPRSSAQIEREEGPSPPVVPEYDANNHTRITDAIGEPNDDLFGDSEIDRLFFEDDGKSQSENYATSPDLGASISALDSHADIFWNKSAMHDLHFEAVNGSDVDDTGFEQQNGFPAHARRPTIDAAWPFDTKTSTPTAGSIADMQWDRSAQPKVVRFSESVSQISSPSLCPLQDFPKLTLDTNIQDQKYSVFGKYGQLSASVTSPGIAGESSFPARAAKVVNQAPVPPSPLKRSLTEPLLRRSSLTSIPHVSKRGWDSDAESDSDDGIDEECTNVPESVKVQFADTKLVHRPLKRSKTDLPGETTDRTSSAKPAQSTDPTSDPVPEEFEHMSATLLHHFFSSSAVSQCGISAFELHKNKPSMSFHFLSSFNAPDRLTVISLLVAEQSLDPTPTFADERASADAEALSTCSVESSRAISCINVSNEMRRLPFHELFDQQGTLPACTSNVAQLEDDSALERPSGPLESLVEKLSLKPALVKRHGSPHAVAVSALAFASSLGIEPLYGHKDAELYTIRPATLANTSTDRFIDNLCATYADRRFGKLSKAGNEGFEAHRVVDADECHASGTSFFHELNSLCAEMGLNIRKACRFKKSIILVLFTSIIPSPAEIQAFCSCFTSFETAIRSSKKATSAKVFLQLIPSIAITALMRLMVDDGDFVARLSGRIYDRLPLPLQDVLALKRPAVHDHFRHHPRVELEDAPQKVQLELSATVPNDVLYSCSRLHVAYCRSASSRWLSAAWSDDLGRRFLTASYSLVGRSLSDTMQEIWKTTLLALQPRLADWHVLIAKTDPMDWSERLEWISIFRKNREPGIRVSLLSVNVSPVLTLTPSAGDVSSAVVESPAAPPVTPKPGFTPTSTPQTTFGSPAPTPGAPTPGPTPGGTSLDAPSSLAMLAEVDPRARLMSSAHDYWSLMLSSPLNAGPSTLSTCVALSSGFIAQRISQSPYDPFALFEVNLLHSDTGAEAGKVVLKEILEVYANLAVLSGIRGIPLVAGLKINLPLHIAVAKRCAEGLDRNMLWP